MYLYLGYILCITATNVYAQRGIFYTPSNPNDEKTIISHSLSNPLADGVARFAEVQLANPVMFFGTRFEKLEVYIDGVVGFGRLLPKCQIPISTQSVLPYLAVYWLANNIGTVTSREATEQQLNLDRNALALDIRNAFPSSNMQPASIKSACYITWYNMSNTDNFNPQRNFNTFQLALVTTEVNNVTMTYEIIVYRLISYAANHKLDGRTQECLSVALISINHEDPTKRFFLSPIFFGRSDWAVIFTNQNDYQLIGRYAFQLGGLSTQQPLPPRLNCKGDNPDPFCLSVNWFAVKAKINIEFCLNRLPGVYPYPIACNRLVKCGFQGARQVLTCPEGLNFNPILSVCDWEVNTECNIPKEVVIITETSTKPGFEPKERQEVIHENKCKFLKNGITSDPADCRFFLSCNNARSTRFKCPETLFYNPITKGCDYPQNVDCKLSTTQLPKTTNKMTTTHKATTHKATTNKVPTTKATTNKAPTTKAETTKKKTTGQIFTKKPSTTWESEYLK